MIIENEGVSDKKLWGSIKKAFFDFILQNGVNEIEV